MISAYIYGVKIIKHFRWESSFLKGVPCTNGSAGYLMQLSVSGYSPAPLTTPPPHSMLHAFSISLHMPLRHCNFGANFANLNSSFDAVPGAMQ